MKKLNRLFLIPAALAFVLTSAEAQLINPGSFQGNLWDANVNQGPAFPTVSAGTATFASSDTQWLQVRTYSNYVGSVRAVFEINPALNSGGVNADQAIVGFGQNWFYYHENPVGEWVPGPGPDSLGVMFEAGSVYIVDGYGSGHAQQFPVGTYSPGQWVQVTLDLSAAGFFQVFGTNISGTHQSTNLYPTVKFIVADGNSSDGFQIRNVSVATTAAPYALASPQWVGNKWSFNNNQGSWFPASDAGVATFALDDFSWGEIRSISNSAGSIRATLEVNPTLLSGGVNGDAAYIGFGSLWTHYGGQPFVGLEFMNGQIAFFDEPAGGTKQTVGSYTPNTWLPLTLDLNSRGLLRVSAPGINSSYLTTNMLANYNLILALKDSSDGMKIRNVTIGPSANLMPAVTPSVYFSVFVQDGVPGQTYSIFRTDNLSSPSWQLATTFVQTTGGFLFVDTNAPATGPHKFYKVSN